MRQALLWLSHQQSIFRFVRSNPLAKHFASRFVAGETLDTAVAAVKELNARRITASLDLLGESVTKPEEALAARDEYLRMLDRIAADGVNANVSVKLTQMGQDISEAALRENAFAILARAKQHNTFVRFDMEGTPYTDRTLDFFTHECVPQYGAHCGVVIQSMLRRSPGDIDRLIGMKARVRLCKGAYLESAEHAFPAKRDVDAQYVALMKQLMTEGNYPGLATHDERIIAEAKTFATANRIAPDRFEFQMLYGVRRDLQEKLRAEGWNVRVYIPFGTQWYPYLMRRLAERPANIAFIMGNVVREAVGGR
ncbi:MAG: proline dehydrogenase family protein [Gemmatimonadota bacterium]